MKYGVLGASGFIGSAVVTGLIAEGNEVIPFGRDGATGGTVDVLVNCAGVTERHRANTARESLWDREQDILDRIYAIDCRHLIHISSIDAAVRPHSGYGQLKLRMEDVVSWTKETCTILRLPLVVGPELKKNVVFDLLTGASLWVTVTSTYNIIRTAQVVEAITQSALRPYNEMHNVTAYGCVSVNEMCDILGCALTMHGGYTERYAIACISPWGRLQVTTSAGNLQDFLKYDWKQP